MPIDYSKYCKDWKLRSKFIRFKRAKNNYEICGVPNRINGVVLTVMHLDHDIKNNSFFNLIAGCQKCHNNYDTEYRKQNRTGQKQEIKTISIDYILNKRHLYNFFFQKKSKT